MALFLICSKFNRIYQSKYDFMGKEYIFELEMQVRDYECDLQGIVNNAVYQNYLEHNRHAYMKRVGLGFSELHAQGIDAVVIKTLLSYKRSLYPGDSFLVRLNWYKKGHMRLVFEQEIYKKEDMTLCLHAETTCAILQDGRPVPATLFDHL